MEPVKDRIERAHELRAAIHAHLKANPDSTMLEIYDALPRVNRATLRKATRKMRDDGDVCMVRHSAAGEGIYRAITAEPKPTAATRRRIADGGRQTQHIAAAACKKVITKRELAKIESQKRREERAAKKAEAAKTAKAAKADAYTEQVTGGKTTYRSGDNPAIRQQQRGQGAVREKVCINCFQLF